MPKTVSEIGAGTSQRERQDMNRGFLWEAVVMQGDQRARRVWVQIWELGPQWRVRQKKWGGGANMKGRCPDV